MFSFTTQDEHNCFGRGSVCCTW